MNWSAHAILQYALNDAGKSFILAYFYLGRYMHLSPILHVWTLQAVNISSSKAVAWNSMIQYGQWWWWCSFPPPPLHYVWFSQFWSHFHGTMQCLLQRVKSTLLEIFWNGAVPKGSAEWEKISTNVDFSLEPNSSALSHKNETKIVKITHSAPGLPAWSESSATVLIRFIGLAVSVQH